MDVIYWFRFFTWTRCMCTRFWAWGETAGVLYFGQLVKMSALKVFNFTQSSDEMKKTNTFKRKQTCQTDLRSQKNKNLLPGAFYHVPKTNYVVTADANLIACKCCLTKTLIYISKRASPKWGIHNLAIFITKIRGWDALPRSHSPIMLKRLCGANCLGIFCTASLYTDRASCGSSKKTS